MQAKKAIDAPNHSAIATRLRLRNSRTNGTARGRIKKTVGSNTANCNGCGSQWDYKQTAPVGSFKPNAFGLYDMHGNVREWVEDCYVNSYNDAPRDGSAVLGSADCSSRVLRGGSWSNNPGILRSAARNSDRPDGSDSNVGFRVARTLD